MTEVINLTGLARTYKVPTPKMTKRLTAAGVKPLQEIQMPSGRKFVLFDKVKSIKALEEHKARRVREEERAAKAEAKAAPKVAEKPAAKMDDTKALRAEVAELTRTVQQLLEVVTKPHKEK